MIFITPLIVIVIILLILLSIYESLVCLIQYIKILSEFNHITVGLIIMMFLAIVLIIMLGIPMVGVLVSRIF